jgi:TrmH family RNA methyltransferase
MGSIARVNVSYVDLNFLSSIDLPVFGTFMEGVNIYKTTLPQEGVVVMGNEANGISKELEALIKNKLSIILENQKRLNVRSNRNCTE